MKSLLGMLFIVLLFIVVVGGGSFVWYLSHSAEFSRKSVPEAADATLPPANR